MKRLFRKMYFMIVIYYYSFKRAFNIGIGDMVCYKGVKHRIHNGTVCGKWTTHTAKGPINMPRSECRKVWSMKGVMSSYKSSISFYKNNWLEIWISEGIIPWMRNCKIW